MAYDAFISYAKADKTIADAVCGRLEASGIRCWIAPRDIIPGKDWSAAIVDAIENSQILVLVFSANANNSEQIKREVECAVNRGHAIIPFRIDDIKPSKSLEYFISTAHWLDAITPPVEKHIDRLGSAIKELLKSLDDENEKQGGEAPPHAPRLEGRSPKRVQSLYVITSILMVAIIFIIIYLVVNSIRNNHSSRYDKNDSSLVKSENIPKEKLINSNLLTSPKSTNRDQNNPIIRPGEKDQVENARLTLLKVFLNLDRTYHHDPYKVTIDLNTGAMTMDNEKVRWEFNLGDLDSSTVYARTWNPGGGQKESRTIGAECSNSAKCVTWGESNGLGGYRRKPTDKWHNMQFEVYRGEGPNYERDLNAEKEAIESFTILIRYFQR